MIDEGEDEEDKVREEAIALVKEAFEALRTEEQN